VSPTKDLPGVLDQLELALTKTPAISMPVDAVVVLELQGDDGQTRVLIGERCKMVPALVADGTLDANSQAFLTHKAPAGYVWAVIDWGEDVSTILHPLPVRDRRAS
jgi:hypothetical protein